MIGMSQIKKKLFTGIAIGGSIGIVGIGLITWWATSTIKSYQEGTNKKFIKTYMQNVAVLTRDVIQGEVITEDMLKDVSVHKSTVPSGVLSSAGVVGSVANFNIPANIPLTSTMVTSEILAGDVREQELNTVLMPSDINIGDFIDIRLMYPNGTDYVVLAAKQVKNVTETTMWIDIGEDERLLLNGAIVDSFLKQGSKLYATKYIDAATQKPGSSTDVDLAREYIAKEYAEQIQTLQTMSDPVQAANVILDFVVKYKNFSSVMSKTIVNYQPNQQIIQMMMTNANILEQAKQKLSAEARANMENAMNAYQVQAGDDYTNIISESKQSISEQKNHRNELLNSVE